jgi:two-component system OmpR family response regulator
MSLNLLIVEDDAPLATMLAEELRELDHVVTIAADGREALDVVGRDRFDAVILDRMLPHVDGISVLHSLRRDNMTLPIIMLSALQRATEKVEGLDAGADDYVVKPVATAELDARLNALLRARGWTSGDGDTIRAGDIIISPKRFRAWRAGKAIDLAKIEFNLLAELARNADTVMTRAMLLERVWGYDFETSKNLVEVYICRLRLKLAIDGLDDPLQTVRGVGYSLRG